MGAEEATSSGGRFPFEAYIGSRIQATVIQQVNKEALQRFIGYCDTLSWKVLGGSRKIGINMEALKLYSLPFVWSKYPSSLKWITVYREIIFTFLGIKQAEFDHYT